MPSVEEMLQDNRAFTIQNTQAHLTILRMFCAVYDALNSNVILSPILSLIEAPGIPANLQPAELEIRRGKLLGVFRLRYGVYLDLLVDQVQRNRHKDEWPLPPWDVALMLHTHMLSPVKFQQDLSGNPRFSKLAGVIEFPLQRLLFRLQNFDRSDVEMKSEKEWKNNPRTSGILYNMMHSTICFGDKTFPPKMYMCAGIVQPKTHVDFSLDLIEAVKSQMRFAQEITALYPYDPVPDALLLLSQERYVKFMNLIRIQGTTMPVPTMDIDLFWHTHQLCTSYLPWCTKHVGHIVNHDDTVPETELGIGLENTVNAWGEHYSEDYILPPPREQSVIPSGLPTTVQQASPPLNTQEHIPLAYRLPTGNPPPGTFPGLSTANTRPPSGLNGAQLALWRFDVSCQAEHEVFCCRSFEKNSEEIRLLESQIQEANRLHSNLTAPVIKPSLNSKGKVSVVRTMFKAAVKGARDGHIPAERRQLNYLKLRYDSALDMRSRYIEYGSGGMRSLSTEEWGRQRWPLLCAARGWGDARVTHGMFKRPPQGSTELPFPIYAATWYSDAGFMYYNYLGGESIEGGGLRLGGGMCGALFDGGNCNAAPVSQGYNN